MNNHPPIKSGTVGARSLQEREIAAVVLEGFLAMTETKKQRRIDQRRVSLDLQNEGFMEKFAIELKFYGEDDEETKVFRKSFVPFGFLKEAMKLTGLADGFGDPNSVDPAVFDQIADFVVAFYGDKFSREELLEHTDASEVFTVIKQISAKASGGANPTIPG